MKIEFNLIELNLFEQKYRSHIIITCLYHNMKYQTYVADIQEGGSKEQLWITVKSFIP